jgi:hypothetical protein
MGIIIGDTERVRGREMDGGFKTPPEPELEPGGEYVTGVKEDGGWACWDEGRTGTIG